MGFFNKLMGEFVDIIEWLDNSGDTMVYRFERYQNEIKNKAKLTVRESQVAVFIEKGKIADIFEPGMYELTTDNLPILSTLKGWPHGFNSPFKAEVYFINTKQFTNLKWGTKNPITLRDPEFGPCRIRAFGNYCIRVQDPTVFIKEIVGTDGNFNTDEITHQLRNLIITFFTDAIGEAKIPVLDMAANYHELGEFIGAELDKKFDQYGLDLTEFLVENISLPPEVEKMLDKRTSMGMMGDLNKFTQFQAAQSMEAAASNPAGGASEGIGLGVGMAMANQMAQGFNNQQQQSQQQNQSQNSQVQQSAAPTPPPIPGQVSFHVVVNGASAGPFNLDQLKQMQSQGQLSADTLVWQEGMANWQAAKEQAPLASLFASMPPPIPGA